MLAAFLSVLADLEWPAVVGITALAWVIAATVEWLAWQPTVGRPGLRRYPAGHAHAPATPTREEPRKVRVIPAAASAERESEPEPAPQPVAVEPEQDPGPVAVEPEPEPEPESQPDLRLEPVAVEPEQDPTPVAVEPQPDPEPELEPEPGPAPEPEPAAEEAVVEPTAPSEHREKRSWLGSLRRRPAQAQPNPPADEELQPEPAADQGLPPEPPAPYERPALRALPAEPEPTPRPAEQPSLAETSVVRLSSRRPPEAREWNVWDLEAIAREESRSDPSRRDEWSYLFVHLRQFADAQGTLPSEFDGLVRESFGDLLEVHDLV